MNDRRVLEIQLELWGDGTWWWRAQRDDGTEISGSSSGLREQVATEIKRKLGRIRGVQK
jgi:hypothetical protein